ncbi:Tat pathway signal protein [Streptomyces sp. NPDC093105]|uniref:Tat pathway signal protein n=1 Tax=Streptomyces sp. NPDC093105 TaxID=3366029 RepID=UPI0037F7283D
MPESAQDDPAPEPTATTDPTPEPTPTVDPTPEPTPTPTDPVTPTATPTADPCPALPLAPLGDPGDAVREVTLEPSGTACFTVAVETPGTHRILVGGDYDTYPALYAGEERVDCEGAPYKDGWCHLTAGRYTLKLTNNHWTTARNQVSLVPLMAGTPGPCPAVPGTGYDTAPVSGTGVGPTGVVCHSFTAAPGERITVDLRRQTYGDEHTWIADATGKRLCTQSNQDGSEGCVLPEGSTGHRVYAIVGPQEDGSPAAPYTLKVRRLSDPAGCATVAPSVYGTAPDQTGPTTGCKTFTPTVTGRYDVRAVSPDGVRGSVPVYRQDGTYACRGYDEFCALTAGMTYTVLTDSALQVFGRAAAEGCVDGGAPGTVQRGTFSAPGEVDCLNLSLPQGARLAVQSDGTTAFSLYDANGAEPCPYDDQVENGTCVLNGTAPFRLIVTKAGSDERDQDYGLVAYRTDAPVACPEFAAGTFAAAPPRSVVRTGNGVFGGCLSIPATAHSATELVEITRTTSAEALIVDARGRVACRLETYADYAASRLCGLTPGVAHTVLVQGRDVVAEIGLTRRDVTATASGCASAGAVAVGGPSAAGSAASGATVCRQVRTASTGDILHLDVRDSASSVAFIVLDSRGEAVCGYWADGCVATGSTTYQMLLDMPVTSGAAVPYRIDAVRIGTPTGPAPECAKVPNVAYGFGPLTGTLSEQRASLCWSLPTATGDRFGVAMSPAGTFATMPRPVLYPRDGRTDLCGGSYTEQGDLYHCALPNEYPKVARPSVLLMVLPEKPAQTSTAVKAQFTCTGVVCGTDPRSIGTVGPATVGKGRISMTVTGSALPASAKVVVRSGTFRAESTTLSVAPDRRSMTVALDLTNAPLGTLSVSVFAFGMEYQKPDVTVVTALRNTAAASVSGTAVVGGKVTAKPGSWSLPVDSLSYQWRANGVAIAGATASTYTIPTTLQGKSLSVAVVARKAGHPTLTSTSAAVTVKGVAPKPTTAPYLTGTVRVGRTLTLNRGTWTPTPTSYAYQWYANGRAISGATRATFTLTSAQRGQAITVKVTAHRTGHVSGYAWTKATGAVAG